MAEERDTQIEELINIVNTVLEQHKKTQEALANSLNALTERISQIEEDYKKIIGRNIFYNAVNKTDSVPDNVKLDLIMKIVNYENNDEE